MIIFDEPLSALDSHVAKHVFNSVIVWQSISKHSTRILVTNALHLWLQCDRIYVINNGRNSRQGTYLQLSAPVFFFCECAIELNCFLARTIALWMALSLKNSFSQWYIRSKTSMKSTSWSNTTIKEIDDKPEPDLEMVEQGTVTAQVINKIFTCCWDTDIKKIMLYWISWSWCWIGYVV